MPYFRGPFTSPLANLSAVAARTRISTTPRKARCVNLAYLAGLNSRRIPWLTTGCRSSINIESLQNKPESFRRVRSAVIARALPRSAHDRFLGRRSPVQFRPLDIARGNLFLILDFLPEASPNWRVDRHDFKRRTLVAAVFLRPVAPPDRIDEARHHHAQP